MQQRTVDQTRVVNKLLEQNKALMLRIAQLEAHIEERDEKDAAERNA